MLQVAFSLSSNYNEKLSNYRLPRFFSYCSVVDIISIIHLFWLQKSRSHSSILTPKVFAVFFLFLNSSPVAEKRFFSRINVEEINYLLNKFTSKGVVTPPHWFICVCAGTKMRRIEWTPISFESETCLHTYFYPQQTSRLTGWNNYHATQ